MQLDRNENLSPFTICAAISCLLAKSIFKEKDLQHSKNMFTSNTIRPLHKNLIDLNAQTANSSERGSMLGKYNHKNDVYDQQCDGSISLNHCQTGQFLLCNLMEGPSINNVRPPSG